MIFPGAYDIPPIVSRNCANCGIGRLIFIVTFEFSFSGRTPRFGQTRAHKTHTHSHVRRLIKHVDMFIVNFSLLRSNYVYTFQVKLQQCFLLRMGRKLSSRVSAKVGLLPWLLGIEVNHDDTCTGNWNRGMRCSPQNSTRQQMIPLNTFN